MSLRKNLCLAAGAVAALGLSAAASAEAFNGPYVGAQIGWQQDRFHGNNVLDKGYSFDANKSSLMGGGFVGYDANLGGSAVVGGEVGFDFGGKYAADTFGGNLIENKARHTVSVTARVGALVQPTTLLYVKGGYVNTNYKIRTLGLSDTANRSGYRIGGGVEQAFTQNVSARLEYFHDGYGKGVNRNQIAVGVAYHF